MNTPVGHELEDLRYAEYVLGVLDANARAAVEREIATDAQAAVEVARWQRHLLPLAEDIDPAQPPDAVWARIHSALEIDQRRKQRADAPLRGWWESLVVWRSLAFGAMAVAVACIIALITLPQAVRAPTPAVPYMASTITQTDGQVGWTATMDLQQARMVVVPAKPQSLPAGHAPELWLIPAGKRPIAVGMIATGGPTTIALSKMLIAQLGPTAALAVSIEPPSGSPTGQPTGAVIAKGTIGAAAQSTTKPVAMLLRPMDAHERA